MDASLTADALGALAQVPPERIERLVRLGLLTTSGGRFAPGDVHRIRLVHAFEAAGVPAEALARANERGAISLDYYDQLHQDPAPPSGRTYGELLRDLGDRGPQVRALIGAFGIAEPEPDDRLSVTAESLLLAAFDALVANRHPDLATRGIRVFGESARRASEAAMSVYAEAVERATADVAGIPPREVYEQFLEPWARFARLVPELAAWLHARHLSAAIDAWSVDETERLLAESGFVPPREVEPPAVAFVDLSGFTQLTEQRGDRTAAAVATDFAELARGITERHDGRLVKQLGDGVLLRFPAALAGVEATLDILDAVADTPLPAGHAGIEAGHLIVRDGDVFGRTVNRASRLADMARPGELLATAALAEGLPAARVHREPAGTVALKGIATPAPLVRLMRRTARPDLAALTE